MNNTPIKDIKSPIYVGFLELTTKEKIKTNNVKINFWTKLALFKWKIFDKKRYVAFMIEYTTSKFAKFNRVFNVINGMSESSICNYLINSNWRW